jgi:hypothetical protein
MNLSYPIKKFFIANPGPANIGVYTDNDSVKKFILKSEGIEILGGSTATWTKLETKNAVKKVVGIALSKNYNEASEDYGIKIVPRRRTPGYVDNSEQRPVGKFYGSKISGLTETAGLYQDAKAVIQEKQIIDMITNDTNNTQFGSSIPSGAIVNARRAYIITDDGTGNASGFTVTKSDGTTYAFTTDSSYSEGQLGIQFNADANVNTILKAYHIGTATYLITSVDNGYNFSIAVGTDTTIVRREILLDSKYDDILYDVQFDTDWATETGYYLFEMTSTDSFAAAVNAVITVNGTDNVCTSGTNIATVITAIDGYTGVNALAWGTTILIAGISGTVTNMAITFPSCNSTNDAPYTTKAYLTFAGTATGSFSILNADDVQRVFAVSNHMGDLSSAVRQPVATTKGAEYVKYTLTSSPTAIGAIHGASHYDNYKQKIELYVPKSSVRADLFYASDYTEDVATTENALLEEAIESWNS